MFVRGIQATGSPTFSSPELGEATSAPDLAPIGELQGPSFGDALGGLVVDAASRSQDATRRADLLARGASDDLHGTLIAAKEAEISVKLVGSIRNKLIDAFQELWRTNV